MAMQIGGSGNDSLVGSSGDDTLVGLQGDDTISGVTGNDVILGNQGNDQITNGDGNSTIAGGMDNDRITVGNGSNLLFGNEGSDTISAGNGGNTIVGGQDSTDGADLITSGSGNDLILGNGGDDTVAAGGGADTVVGGFGADIILGNQGNDFLLGNQGDDTLYGGMGDDTLVGGQGNDVLIGGEGNDIVAFSGTRASYGITQNAAGDFVLSGADGIDTVSSVERFQFSDGTVDAVNLIQGSGGGVVVPPAPSADLSVTATVSNARPVVGDQILFTDTLTNNGPDGATGVSVQDLLPAGVTFVSARPSRGSYNPATGAWIVGALASNAQASLIITATASSYGSSTNSVSVTNSSPNDPNTNNNSAAVIASLIYTPQAQPDTNSYVEGSNQPVVGNVLNNDVRSPGEMLSVLNSGTYDKTYGTITLNQDGSYTVGPKDFTNVIGADNPFNIPGPHTDQVPYTAVDQVGVTTTSSLTIDYLQPPTANPDSYTTQENSPLILPANEGVLSNDTSTNQLAVAGYTMPQHGTLTLNRDGSLSYAPNQGYYGSDTFNYTATDGTLTSRPTQVNIDVTDIPPLTGADNYTTVQNSALTIPASGGLLANDTSPNPITIGSFTQPAHGNSIINPDGSFTYVPNNGYFGTDSFSYMATDGNLSSVPTPVTINVLN